VAGSVTVIIDDSDQMVSYDGGWTQEADPNAVGGTTHYSEVIGSLASITFTGVY
jgi:hypothetical protein